MIDMLGGGITRLAVHAIPYRHGGLIISTDSGMGRKWLIGFLTKKRVGDKDKVVESEYDIQRSKTGFI